MIAMITDDADRAAEALDEARGDQQRLVVGAARTAPRPA